MVGMEEVHDDDTLKRLQGGLRLHDELQGGKLFPSRQESRQGRRIVAEEPKVQRVTKESRDGSAGDKAGSQCEPEDSSLT